MREIEVFGTGCKKCIATKERIKVKADELGIDITITEVKDPVDIASRGIMSTPAVIVDGKLVHKGGLPESDEIAAWLR